MKIEKINAMDNILESIQDIKNNFLSISKSGDFVGSLIAEGFKTDELVSKKEVFNKEMLRILEEMTKMEKFVGMLNNFSKQIIEMENNKIKQQKPANKMLDLRSHEDLGIDERDYQITMDDGSKWFSKIEID
jgi:hypothetical protein